MWTFRRWAWYTESGGGETAVYKSSDGGATWTRLSGPDANRGLPKGLMDRIGIAVSRSNPNIVYVVSETKDEGELWRTDDAGATWRMVSRDPNINFRPFYYADIRVDPQHPNTVYALAGSLYKSEDGGRTLRPHRQRDARRPPGDVDRPDQLQPHPDAGTTAGSRFRATRDGRSTSSTTSRSRSSTTSPTTCRRPITCAADCRTTAPGAARASRPARRARRGASGRTWAAATGSSRVPDLKDPHLVYNNLQGGVISLTDRRTGASWGINPYPGGIGSSGQWMAPQKYRFNWNAPIVLAPQDPKTVYYGGNVLFKTTELRAVVGGDQPRPDDERQGEAAVVGRQDRHRQHRGRVPLHDHLDRAVAGRSQRHLGGHRRRERAGDARRREDVDQHGEGE